MPSKPRHIIALPFYWIGCILYDAGETILTWAAKLDGTI